MPVWTSSNTSAAPTSSHAGADRSQQLGRHHVHARLAADFGLDQHRRGVFSSTAAATPTRPRRGSPARSGANGACLVLRVALDAPYVRPWNPFNATTRSPRGRWCLRTSLIAAFFRRLRPRQLEVEQAPSPNERSHEPRARGVDVRLVVEQVGDMHQRRGLPLHGVNHGRVAVAEVVDRDPAEEVQVGVPLRVGEPRARPPTNSTGYRAYVFARLTWPASLSFDAGVRRHFEQQRCGTALDDVGVHDAAVDRLDAGLQLRAHPLPSTRRASTSSAPASEITLVGSAGSRSHPGTSVRNMTLYAPMARAIAPAASSALTLCERRLDRRRPTR